MGNSWSNTAITSLTIPTGATAGARVVIDGTTGFITVYNTAGTVVDTIGGPAGDITVYGVSVVSGTTRNIVITDGQIQFSAVGVNASLVPASIRINQVRANLVIEGGVGSGGADNNASLSLVSGGFGAVRCSIQALDANQVVPADVRVSGATVACDLAGIAYTWQTPGYAANWADTAVFFGLGGGSGLRYRHMAEDDVWLYGLATTAAGAGTTVFTLAAGYFSTHHTTYGTVLRNRGGALADLPVAIDTAGNVLLGAAPAAGDEYMFNMRVPTERLEQIA